MCSREEDPNWFASWWHIGDVRNQDPTLSDGECRDILYAIMENHDASIGINWDVIDYSISRLKSGTNPLK